MAIQELEQKRQTALHIAIEKGLKDIVKILVENGADVQIPATGSFFQLNRNREDCFYFGQYPLSLAACLNQTEIVEFLLDREHKPSNPDARDYLGNTVLHALVMVADDTEKTHFVTDMYDLILKKSEEKIIEKKEFSKVNLEKLRNNEGLTPLQLAAKEGKLQLFRHILSREFPINDRMHHLSRRFVEWTYGPICTSLYDLDEVDTTDQQSALKIVVYSNKQDKYCNLLDVEPLKELIEVKWKMFAALMFGVSTAWYLHYIILFTLITALQPHVTKSESSFWLTFGKIYIFIVALGILVKTAFDTIVMWPFQLYSFLKNSYFHILFVFQSCLVVGSLLQYWDGNENFVVMQAMGLMIGWFNLLYFSRGFKFTGIYTVFIQRNIPAFL
ncbi:transient receptor potential cation channel subfamily V member 2-like [Ornithorhynchus anatinus]|uniref:transient receptor potential cation channel subfamily V member 2-like n=1 Tax=Ornithorhynchus anatinus TaxID=9258 RepID=UPI0019D4E7AF|nr:transient receptor potential cation channel subfamily V member 2-like [Ornithorhynchus anatinus]